MAKYNFNFNFNGQQQGIFLYHDTKKRYSSITWSFSIQLPANVIRNLTGCSLEKFKHVLDKYLAKIPDEPQLPGYTSYRRAESNSLVHMTNIREC